MKKGNQKGNSFKIYAAGLHTIYKAMEGHRLFGSFGSFGFKLPSKEVSNNKSRSGFENWSYEFLSRL